MAKAFLASLEVDFDTERYHDEYQAQLAKLVERKATEGDIAVQPERTDAPASTPATDIMAALEASLARHRATRGGSGSSGARRTSGAHATKKHAARSRAKRS